MKCLLSLITFAVLSSAPLAIAPPGNTPSSRVTEALAVDSALSRRQAPPRNVTSGFGDDGYFYYYATDTAGNSTFENQDGGTYSMTWTFNGWHVAGKGWNPGAPDRVVNYNGTMSYNGNTMVGVEGWTRQPLINYLIIDGYGSYNPAYGTRKGSITCNGAGYDVSTFTRYNQDSIDGIQTYSQYWSTRSPPRYFGGVPAKGTIDVACHVAGWKSFGLELGTEFDYQIMATDAYYNSGSVTVTVS